MYLVKHWGIPRTLSMVVVTCWWEGSLLAPRRLKSRHPLDLLICQSAWLVCPCCPCCPCCPGCSSPSGFSSFPPLGTTPTSSKYLGRYVLCTTWIENLYAHVPELLEYLPIGFRYPTLIMYVPTYSAAAPGAGRVNWPGLDDRSNWANWLGCSNASSYVLWVNGSNL